MNSKIIKKLCFFMLTFVLVFALAACDNNQTSQVVDESYTISGTVVDGNGNAIDGVSISITGDTDLTVDLEGGKNWSANVEGTVTVTPVKDGWTFTPSPEEVSSATDSLDFVGAEDSQQQPQPQGLTVDSVTAVDGKTIQITFSDPIDEAMISNFAVTGATIKDVIISEDGKSVTIKLNEYIPYGSQVFFNDITVEGESADVDPVEVDNSNVDNPGLLLESNKDVITVVPDGASESADITVSLLDFPEGVEATIAFDASWGQLSHEELTSSVITSDIGTVTVRLYPEEDPEDVTAVVRAHVISAKNPATGEVWEEYKNVPVAELEVDFRLEDGTVNNGIVYEIERALADQADRVFIRLDKDLTDAALAYMNNHLGQIEVYDNINGDYERINVQKVVRKEEGVKDNQIFLILDRDDSDFPLTDNARHKVVFNGNPSASTVLGGESEFYLEDTNYLKLKNVYTADTAPGRFGLKKNELLVVFSEAVNDFEEDIESVRNLNNWVIDGLNLGNNLQDWSAAVYPVDLGGSVTLETVNTDSYHVSRDAVKITFNDYLDTEEFLVGSDIIHKLEVSSMIGDWASVTDSVNTVATQEDEYRGIEIDEVTLDWYIDGDPDHDDNGVDESPEQFIAEFSDPDVEYLGYEPVESGNMIGSREELCGAFEIIIPNTDTSMPLSWRYKEENRTATLYGFDPFEIPGSVQAVNPHVTIDPNGNTIVWNAFLVKRLKGGKFIIEMRYDWTQLYDTTDTGNNYHMPEFNPLRLVAHNFEDYYGRLVGINGNKVAKPDLTLVEDTYSPEPVNLEQLTFTHDDHSDMFNENVVVDVSRGILPFMPWGSDNLELDVDDVNIDFNIENLRIFGQDINLYADAGAVLITMNEPVQFSDANWLVETIPLTPSQQQYNYFGGRVPSSSFEYVKMNNGQTTNITVEGRIMVLVDEAGLEGERDYSAVIVPVEALSDGNWKLTVRDITDDIGNAMETVELNLEIDTYVEPLPDLPPLQLVAVDAHYQANSWLELDREDPGKDIIHVLFNKPMKLNGVASVLNKLNWRLDGEALPVDGTRIERGILGDGRTITQYISDENPGVDFVDSVYSDDMQTTRCGVTIILPDGYLQQHNDDHVLSIIDVESVADRTYPDGEICSERVQIPYNNSNPFGHYSD